MSFHSRTVSILTYPVVLPCYVSSYSINIPRAKRELSQLNRCTSPLHKLLCLRKVSLTIMQSPSHSGMCLFFMSVSVHPTYAISCHISSSLHSVTDLHGTVTNGTDSILKAHLHSTLNGLIVVSSNKMFAFIQKCIKCIKS